MVQSSERRRFIDSVGANRFLVQWRTSENLESNFDLGDAKSLHATVDAVLKNPRVVVHKHNWFKKTVALILAMEFDEAFVHGASGKFNALFARPKPTTRRLSTIPLAQCLLFTSTYRFTVLFWQRSCARDRCSIFNTRYSDSEVTNTEKNSSFVAHTQLQFPSKMTPLELLSCDKFEPQGRLGGGCVDEELVVSKEDVAFDIQRFDTPKDLASKVKGGATSGISLSSKEITGAGELCEITAAPFVHDFCSDISCTGRYNPSIPQLRDEEFLKIYIRLHT
ncbi:hypothetical protein EV360DRAFT_76874 [Lentinula raphanica]|nr:hypothetical protein EV360DRAFT_76874 [Lentinula raphanica]